MNWGCGFIRKQLWTQIKNAVPDDSAKHFESKSDRFYSIRYAFEHISKLYEYVLAVFQERVQISLDSKALPETRKYRMVFGESIMTFSYLVLRLTTQLVK